MWPISLLELLFSFSNHHCAPATVQNSLRFVGSQKSQKLAIYCWTYCIISKSGWIWAICWAQLGVRIMNCVAFTEMSMEYGQQLISTLSFQGYDLTFQGPHKDSFVVRGDPTCPHVVCGHLLSNPGPSLLNFKATIPATSFLLLTLDQALLPLLQQTIGGHYHWECQERGDSRITLFWKCIVPFFCNNPFFIFCGISPS
jgi:hypothetical protein